MKRLIRGLGVLDDLLELVLLRTGRRVWRVLQSRPYWLDVVLVGVVKRLVGIVKRLVGPFCTVRFLAACFSMMAIGLFIPFLPPQQLSISDSTTREPVREKKLEQVLGVPIAGISELPFPPGPGEAITAEYLDELDAALVPVRPRLALLASRTDAVWSMSWTHEGRLQHHAGLGELPHIGILLSPIRSMRHEMQLAAHRGDPTRAVTTALTALKLAHLASDVPARSDPWDGIYGPLMGRLHVLSTLSTTPALRGADPTQLSKLRELLSLTEPAADTIARAIEAEPDWFCDMLARELASRPDRTVTLPGLMFDLPGPRDAAERGAWIESCREAMRVRAFSLARAIEAGPEHGSAVYRHRTRELQQRRFSVLALLAGQLQCALSSSARAAWFAQSVADEVSPNLRSGQQLLLDARMMHRLVDLRVRLELYRQQHGRWPAALADLGVPADRLVDVAAGAPLRYTLTGDTYALSAQNAPFHTWAASCRAEQAGS